MSNAIGKGFSKASAPGGKDLAPKGPEKAEDSPSGPPGLSKGGPPGLAKKGGLPPGIAKKMNVENNPKEQPLVGQQPPVQGGANPLNALNNALFQNAPGPIGGIGQSPGPGPIIGPTGGPIGIGQPPGPGPIIGPTGGPIGIGQPPGPGPIIGPLSGPVNGPLGLPGLPVALGPQEPPPILSGVPEAFGTGNPLAGPLQLVNNINQNALFSARSVGIG